MKSSHPVSLPASIVWVYAEPVALSLDSATWLDTTRELRALGWQVSLIAEGSAGTRTIHGVEVECRPKPQIYFLGVLVFHLGLLRFLLERWSSTDIILFHQVSAPCLLPLRLVRSLRRHKRPLLVMDTRDLIAAEGTLKSWLRRRFFGATHWLANRWADGQTTITPRMADLVGIPSSQLWGIWPSGVNLERFVPAQANRRWPMPGEPIRLIYVGKLRVKCNLLSLCQAVEAANAQGMAFLLGIVGEGPERPALEEFAARTEGRVQVRPAVPHDQIPDLLRQAHIGVTALPSADDRLFQASSPVKLFEYMAAGLPIFSTENVCHTEVVGQRSFGFWAREPSVQELLAALRQVWNSTAKLSVMGREAAQAALDWTWQNSGKKLSESLLTGLQMAEDR